VAAMRAEHQRGRQVAVSVIEHHSRADKLLTEALQQQGAARQKANALADLMDGFGAQIEEVARAQEAFDEQLACALVQLGSAQANISGLEEREAGYLEENVRLREEVAFLTARNAELVAADEEREETLDLFRMDQHFHSASG